MTVNWETRVCADSDCTGEDTAIGQETIRTSYHSAYGVPSDPFSPIIG